MNLTVNADAQKRSFTHRVGAPSVILGLFLAVFPLLFDHTALGHDLNGQRALAIFLYASMALSLLRDTHGRRANASDLRPLLGITLCWIIAMVVSSSATATYHRGLVRSMEWGGWALAILALAVRSGHPSGLFRILSAGFWIGFGISFIHILVRYSSSDLLSQAPPIDHPRIPGCFNVRHFGHVATAGVILASWHLIARDPSQTIGRPRAKRWLGLVLLTAAWTGVIWSGGRAPILGLIFGIALLYIITPPPGRRALIIAQVAAIIAGTLCSILITPASASILGLQSILGRGARILSADLETASSGRIHMWLAMWEAFRANPMLGIGLDNYVMIDPNPLSGDPYNRAPCNVIVQIFSEQGLIGGGMASLFLIRLLRHPCRVAWMARNQDDGAHHVLRVGLAGTLTLFIVAILSPVFYFIWSMALCAIFLAITAKASLYLRAGNGPAHQAPPPEWQRWGIGIYVGAALTIAGIQLATFMALQNRPNQIYARTDIPWLMRAWPAVDAVRLRRYWVRSLSKNDKEAALALAREFQRTTAHPYMFEAEIEEILNETPPD